MRYFKNSFVDYTVGQQFGIDIEKWKSKIEFFVKQIILQMPPTLPNCDGGLYVGCAGVGYMLTQLASSDIFESDRKTFFAETAWSYCKVSKDYYNKGHCSEPPCSFLLGKAGCLLLDSISSKILRNDSHALKIAQEYMSLSQYCQPINFFPHGSDELFMGRAGFLCGALALKQKVEKTVVSNDVVSSICHVMVESGRQYVYSRKYKSQPPPLMYAYYDTEYLGAAHGISGILQMLLSFPEFFKSEDPTEQNAVMDVKKAVDYLLNLEQKNHNYPPAMDEVSSGGRPAEHELVHWCHGAPGIVYLFARAYQVWTEDKYLQACIRCAELTWHCGLLKKGPGICHGVAGSGYVFLLLYRLTHDEKYLYRAQMFAEFLFSDEFKRARVPDSPYSLFEGWAGTVLFLLDLCQPEKAEFPLYNVMF